MKKYTLPETLAFLLIWGVFGAACASGPIGSIGAVLGQGSDGRVFVREIPPGQGADKAGLELDDEIVAIDGKPVQSLTLDEVRTALRGDVGTTMTLTVERYGKRRDVKVERSSLAAEKKK